MLKSFRVIDSPAKAVWRTQRQMKYLNFVLQVILVDDNWLKPTVIKSTWTMICLNNEQQSVTSLLLNGSDHQIITWTMVFSLLSLISQYDQTVTSVNLNQNDPFPQHFLVHAPNHKTPDIIPLIQIQCAAFYLIFAHRVIHSVGKQK